MEMMVRTLSQRSAGLFVVCPGSSLTPWRWVSMVKVMEVMDIFFECCMRVLVVLKCFVALLYSKRYE